MKNLLEDKKNLLILFALLLTTVVLNGLIFSKQLSYGFRDVDWQVLYYFKLFGNLSFNHLLQEFKILGIYTPESYYVGLLEQFLGLNFLHLYQATHIFKIISAVSLYILILLVLKNRLLAFLSSLIYTTSYTHAGVIFQLATGGYFLATIAMCSFLISYYYSLTKATILKWSIISGVLLITALVLRPERMYPLIFLTLLVEGLILALGDFKKDRFVSSLKRLCLIFLPLIIFIFCYQIFVKENTPVGFTPNQFFIVTNSRIDSLLNGNLHLLIYPFASLGSIFLFDDYWKLLGQLSFQNLGSYLTSLIFGPIFRLGIVTFTLFLFVHKKPFRLTASVMAVVLFFGLIVYALNINWQNINFLTRVHFDVNFLAIPAIFGFYIFALGTLFIIKWHESRDPKILPVILGFFFAFLFILVTWIPSDLQLVFMGPQRYLSIPSIGTSLFIAGLLVIIYDRIKNTKATANFAWMIFLLLIPLIMVNYQVASKFFDYELTYAGLRGSDQIRMKEKLRNLAGEINRQDQSLFYFDETADKDNGYFDESTIIAGFEYWTRINPDGTLNYFPDPGMIRTSIQCPEHTHQNCIGILKAGLAVVDGQQGIWYQDPIRGNVPRFYQLKNLHAFRFINKDIIDIRAELLKELNF